MSDISDQQDITSYSATSYTDYFGGYDPGYIEPAPEIVVRPEVEQVLTLDSGTSPILQTTTVSPLPVQSIPLPTSAPLPVPDLSETDLPTTVPIVQAGSDTGQTGFNWWWLLLLAGGVYMLSKKRKIK